MWINTQQLSLALTQTTDLTEQEVIEATQMIIEDQEYCLTMKAQSFEQLLELCSPYSLPHHVVDTFRDEVTVVFNF